MDKVVRRAALAANQAKRKARIQAARDRRDEIRKYFQERQRYERLLRDRVHAERKTRREDWLKGPLAPKRDAAELDGVYGTLPPQLMNGVELPREDRTGFVNFAVGDRVVVVKGRERGKIGIVGSVDVKTRMVTVNEMNAIDIRYPKFILQEENDKRQYRTISLPYSFNDVRLVVPLSNDHTGKLEDVVVKHMYGGEPFLEHGYGVETPRHTRYISGLDVEIPWPNPTAPDYEDQPVDTLRLQVEERSHIPYLNDYPFPSSVIDELRNKFSKFRTRHDPEWAAMKEEEDRLMREHETKTWVTPKTSAVARKIKQREMEREQQRDENGNYIIPEETASYIEQFLAKKAARKQKQKQVS
ncbi:hypothetical protein AJ79_07185 [Helicocarpus griseus UAMH5409]|uniref:KOW domain-containing protein n=1 Tax=Helicocarpus griseus UAMH5409 TaxID=1447875 RepID=A0A2B7X565_9EURO|nr:hypothetical protein AJ79_07185 [Helicocarpus griseus UAMH5409]